MAGPSKKVPARKPVAAKPRAVSAAVAPPADALIAKAPAETPVVATTPQVEKAPVAESVETLPPLTVSAPAEEVAPAAPAMDITPPKPEVASVATEAPKPAKEGLKMVDVVETTKKYAEQAKEKLGAAFADMSAKAKDMKEKSTAAMGEISDLTKGNVEAVVESGKIAAKGFETLGQEAAEYSRANFEKASATMKSFAAVKSPAEFFQLQSELLTSSFDTLAKETAKNSEAMLKLAGDIVQPISNRVTLVTDKMKALAN